MIMIMTRVRDNHILLWRFSSECDVCVLIELFAPFFERLS